MKQNTAMKGIHIDRSSIEKLLKDFHILTGIRIAFITPEQGEVASAGKTICRFCQLLRRDPSAAARCTACDQAAFAHTGLTGTLLIYKCHAGLTEAVVPVYLPEKELIGYIMLGQVLDMPPTGDSWLHVRLACAHYAVDIDALEKAFYQLPHFGSEKIMAAADIMEMASKHLHHSELVKPAYHTTLQKMIAYIEQNVQNPITIQELSEAMSLSRSHISHLLKSALNTTFTQYLLDSRINMSKDLLETTDRQISSISEEVGIQDPNYFARSFKKIMGETPSNYRQRLRQQKGV